jgi:hypothetical protein
MVFLPALSLLPCLHQPAALRTLAIYAICAANVLKAHLRWTSIQPPLPLSPLSPPLPAAKGPDCSPAYSAVLSSDSFASRRCYCT